jgi:hypothetical protein
MLSKRKVTIIVRLIDQGLSDRQISRISNTSRGKIALMRKRKKHVAPMPVRPQTQVAPGKRRCPECGGMVYGTCQLCRTRRVAVHAFQPELNFRQLARQTLLVALMQPPLRLYRKDERRAS